MAIASIPIIGRKALKLKPNLPKWMNGQFMPKSARERKSPISFFSMGRNRLGVGGPPIKSANIHRKRWILALQDLPLGRWESEGVSDLGGLASDFHMQDELVKTHYLKMGGMSSKKSLEEMENKGAGRGCQIKKPIPIKEIGTGSWGKSFARVFQGLGDLGHPPIGIGNLPVLNPDNVVIKLFRQFSRFPLVDDEYLSPVGQFSHGRNDGGRSTRE